MSGRARLRGATAVPRQVTRLLGQLPASVWSDRTYFAELPWLGGPSR